MRVAVVTIAKNEDNYIDEWMQYNFLLGVDDIFIYQNDWRYSGKYLTSDKVHPIEWDGSCKQLPAYNDFLENKSKNIDFGVFIDVDEFICIKDGISSIKDYLSQCIATSQRPFCGIALNWRFFGDSRLTEVKNNNYSLLNRFTMCDKELNQHVKTIVNLNFIQENQNKYSKKALSFINPHFILVSIVDQVVYNSNLTRFVSGPFNYNEDLGTSNAWINHYFSKTIQEYKENKIPKGKCDFEYDAPEQNIKMQLFYEHNKNDVECVIARDFFNKHK